MPSLRAARRPSPDAYTPAGEGNFGPATEASVKAFQAWGGVAKDGVVGDQTWAVSLHAASATLESAVGQQSVRDRLIQVRSPLSSGFGGL
jgi:peptidoglycan hydrolase-like protein with peptidoglycan-binding domain